MFVSCVLRNGCFLEPYLLACHVAVILEIYDYYVALVTYQFVLVLWKAFVILVVAIKTNSQVYAVVHGKFLLSLLGGKNFKRYSVNIYRNLQTLLFDKATLT